MPLRTVSTGASGREPWKTQGVKPPLRMLSDVYKRQEQLSFTYNEAEAYVSGTKAAAEKPVEVRAHERKQQSGNVLDVVPAGARTEVVEHRLPENERICSACGSQMVEIGKDVRRTLQMKPAEFWICLLYTSRCV